jgi:hypothetical protein
VGRYYPTHIRKARPAPHKQNAAVDWLTDLLHRWKHAGELERLVAQVKRSQGLASGQSKLG